MRVDEVLFHLELHGWCVLENVIPEGGVRESIEATAAEQVGNEPPDSNRVAVNIRNIINENQSFAPYLADERILGPRGWDSSVSIFLGGCVRIRIGRRVHWSGNGSWRRRGLTMRNSERERPWSPGRCTKRYRRM